MSPLLPSPLLLLYRVTWWTHSNRVDIRELDEHLFSACVSFFIISYYELITYISLEDLLIWHACFRQGMAPLSAAEKQRRYRVRRDADPERRQQYLNKEKEKWRKDREEGRKKKVSELSEREKRAQRKKWRERKRKFRERARILTPDIPPEPENAPVTGPSRLEDS